MPEWAESVLTVWLAAGGSEPSSRPVLDPLLHDETFIALGQEDLEVLVAASKDRRANDYASWLEACRQL